MTRSDEPNAAVTASSEYVSFRERLLQRPSDPSASMEAVRSGYEAHAQAMSNRDLDVSVRSDLLGAIPVEIHEPDVRSDGDVMLYFHGGGYCIGSLATHRSMCGALAEAAEVTVIAVDYRLAPEHPFPAAYHDALAAYQALTESPLADKHVIVAGDSAGGGLALATILGAANAGLREPSCGVLISPMTNLSVGGGSYLTRADDDPIVSLAAARRYATAYLDGGDPTDPRASPVYADLSGLPPMHVQVGADEVLLNDSLLIARAMREAGVRVDLDVWPYGLHVLPFFESRLPEGRRALESVARYVRSRCREG
ncbi:alpha/beta hydrolase [Cumulibacter soli]|uniref:alpha/beta hydrolase n=1 Tax=Cumulibacter soli TaxID=2546344 RepID=UPI00106759AF|nr:alpha/beta hydrolase [Cumulibacter soli]